MLPSETDQGMRGNSTYSSSPKRRTQGSPLGVKMVVCRLPLVTLTRKVSRAGSSIAVPMHDGSLIYLQKLANDWNPLDRHSAMNKLYEAKATGEILTGLIYIDVNSADLHGILKTVDTPLNQLTESDLNPGNEALGKINASFR